MGLFDQDLSQVKRELELHWLKYRTRREIAISNAVSLSGFFRCLHRQLNRQYREDLEAREPGVFPVYLITQVSLRRTEKARVGGPNDGPGTIKSKLAEPSKGSPRLGPEYRGKAGDRMKRSFLKSQTVFGEPETPEKEETGDNLFLEQERIRELEETWDRERITRRYLVEELGFSHEDFSIFSPTYSAMISTFAPAAKRWWRQSRKTN